MDDPKLALVVKGDYVTIRGMKDSPMGKVIDKQVVLIANQRYHQYTIDFGDNGVRKMFRGQFDKVVK